MNTPAPALAAYRERYRTQAPAAAEPLRRIRDAALEWALARGFPAARDEAWKYTSTRALEQRTFPPVTEADLPSADLLDTCRIPGYPTTRLVFAQGRFIPSLSDPLPAQGVTLALLDLPARSTVAESLLSLPEHWRDDVFANLNTAFFKAGVVLEVAANTQVKHPFEILHLALPGTAASYHPRMVLRLNHDAQLTLLERYVGVTENAYFTNSVMQIQLEANAALKHVRLQTESPQGFHVGRVLVEQARDSHYHSHNLHAGGQWARLDLHTRLCEPGANAVFDGLYAVNGYQHVDNHTRIDHLAPHTHSEELYRGILDGHGRAVFNGKVVVAPHAVKTDAQQANHNLLLSRSAEIDTKPELEIYADDVKCDHGATVGQLDDEALFYLRSRGVDAETAREILTGAFARVIADCITSPELRGFALAQLASALPQAAAGESA